MSAPVLSQGVASRAERSGPVLRLTMAVPARRNAIGPAMTGELLAAIQGAQGDDGVRVIVLTGEGKAFCAGADFSSMGGGPLGSAPQAASPPPVGDFAGLLLALARSEKPVVARVNGLALGGGMGLVAASTFALASRDAQLGTPEIDVGLFPMMIMAVLHRLLPRRKLLSMMLLGERITADEALAYGLVNAVVDPGDLDRATEELVARLLTKSPTATRLGLRAFGAQDDLALAEALPLLRDRLGEALGTDDAREGLTAFLEKRPPSWPSAREAAKTP